MKAREFAFIEISRTPRRYHSAFSLRPCPYLPVSISTSSLPVSDTICISSELPNLFLFSSDLKFLFKSIFLICFFFLCVSFTLLLCAISEFLFSSFYPRALVHTVIICTYIFNILTIFFNYRIERDFKWSSLAENNVRLTLKTFNVVFKEKEREKNMEKKTEPELSRKKKTHGTFSFILSFRTTGVLARCKITDRTYCFLLRCTHRAENARVLPSPSVYARTDVDTHATRARVSCPSEQKVTCASAPSFLQPSEVRLITKRYVRKPAQPPDIAGYVL